MRSDLMMPPGFDLEAAQAHRNARVFVYFVEGAGLIKIGHATNPVDRFFGMLTGCPVPLSLLAAAPGGPTLETALHRRFAGSRAHGEWFRTSAELSDVIAAAPRQYGDEFRNRLALFKTDRDASGPKRRKAVPSIRRALRDLRPDKSYPARYDGL